MCFCGASGRAASVLAKRRELTQATIRSTITKAQMFWGSFCRDSGDRPVAKIAARAKVEYVCSECGSVQMKWLGKCPDCSAWNTLEEVAVRPAEKTRTSLSGAIMPNAQPVSLAAIPEDGLPRVTLTNSELNRVLGGGIVPGAGILVGGDPGIGKSTILLQMAAEVAANVGNVLYVSGEESDHQIGRRGSALGHS